MFRRSVSVQWRAAFRNTASGLASTALRGLTFFAKEVNSDPNRVRDCGHGDDFHGETQWAWNIDNRVDGEKNRRKRNGCAANRRDTQPDRSARTNRTRAEDRDRKHR